MEDEEDVINKELNEYGSFLAHPQIVRHRILRFGRKDQAIKGQLYQRKSPVEPKLKVDLNKEDTWFKQRREASPQYTEEDYKRCKKICTNVIEEETVDSVVPAEADVNKLNFENYLRSCLKEKNPERKNLKVRWSDLEKLKVKKDKKKEIRHLKKEKKEIKEKIKEVKKEDVKVRQAEPIEPNKE